MSVMVSILGVVMVAIGVLGVVQPHRLVDFVTYFRRPTRFRIAILVRLILGVALLIAAPYCRWPLVVQLIGMIAILAAVVILACGQKRLDTLIAWWVTRPPAVMRVSALFALGFGALLVYAGAEF